ncbi:hypothetical protein CBR_g68780 [Chara braunii]|uniref:DUF4360 domain-containing protein n=1 Tax=Chara braunii TaxID=69332 RepID=A0A388K9N8_CHABU|nr:hypothetical protein CBR_g68780 [Chara braunii]|eukprot:GBG66794.1 hypothetical protein CBR_g68780 [Chara braunii]
MAASLLIAAALLGACVCAQDVPPEARIESFTYNGAGCRQGTAVGDISVDGQALTIKFSEFGVSTDEQLVGKRKFCQLSIKVNSPAGWKYRLDTVTLLGYARLDANVKSVHKVTCYLTGTPGMSSFFVEKEGPLDDNYEYSGAFDNETYSVCGPGGNLNLKMEVRINNDADPAAEGVIDVDTADSQVTFEPSHALYVIKFTPC